MFKGPNGPVELPARTILVAAGTSPNITYEKEQPGTFQLDSKQRFFQGFRAEGSGGAVSLEPDPAGFFTSYNNDGRLVSYYGDNHPMYAGNVVKAMASAKDGYRTWRRSSPATVRSWIRRSRTSATRRGRAGRRARRRAAGARWSACERLTPTIVEVVVRAPAAARHFRPGQFYRLQNFEALAPRAGPHGARRRRASPLLMEGIALTGAWVDREQGAAVADRARDGRLEPAVRVPASRASRSW